LEIRARSGNLVVASAPLDQIRELARLPQVLRLEGPSPATPTLALSVPDVRADEIWEDPALGWDKGDGVISGMVDTGINLQHEAFRDDAGNSRVQYVWDMSDSGGPPPEEDVCGYWDVEGNWVSASCFGSECNPQQIAEDACRQRDMEIPGVMPHGTAVMGTQAANWFGCDTDSGERCRGVAPLADIVAVKLTEMFTNVEIAEGTSYIFRKADALGLAAVVNLSLGIYRGPRDGSSVFEKFMTDQTGPARIVVASAGNEGLNNEHAEARLSGVNPLNKVYAQMDGGSGQKRSTHLQGWYSYDGTQEIKVRILRKFFQEPEIIIEWLEFGESESVEKPQVGPLYGVSLEHTESTDTARGFIIEIWTQESPAWEYQVEMFADGLGGEQEVVVDLWIDPLSTSQKPDGESVFAFDTRSASAAKTLTPPCTADGVICVSSYNTRCPNGLCGQPLGGDLGNDTVGTFSAFSSRGPRRDGASKPEVGAPGQALVVPSSPGQTTYGSYAVGTSFSSPHVAGAVTLVLRNNPAVTSSDIIDSIRGTARPWQIDEATWERETGGYRGIGKLDAFSLVTALSTLPIPPTGLAAQVVRGNHVQLSWIASPSDDVVSYNIYYDRGTGDMDYLSPIGSVPANVLTWISPWPLSVGSFSFGVRAVNVEGEEDKNRFVAIVQLMPQLFGGAGDDDICFIATAAFQDVEAPQVVRLREFRDRFLLPNAWGRAFVDAYYRHSPPLAEWLKKHRLISAGVRVALLPVVGCADLMVRWPSAGPIVAAGGAILLLAVFVGCRRNPFVSGER
jgi:subtilisin family serine protease